MGAPLARQLATLQVDWVGVAPSRWFHSLEALRGRIEPTRRLAGWLVPKWTQCLSSSRRVLRKQIRMAVAGIGLIRKQAP